MTDTLIVFPPDDTHPNDSAPVSWSRPDWAVEVGASDGYLFYYGQWVVANPGADRTDQVRVRLSGSDEFQLAPDGAVVAVSQPITVEIRDGDPVHPGSLPVMPIDQARALAATIRVLCGSASTGQRAA
jgi:hypothetical protein